MKNIFLLFSLLVAVQTFAQQDSITEYYNKKWEKTEDRQNATYLRRAAFSKGLWRVNDYYKKNGMLQMSGTYAPVVNGDSLRQGEFVYYDEKGWKVDEGKYLNNERTGEWNGWDEHGKKLYTAMYEEGYMVGDYTSWYSNGNLYCTKQYLQDIAAVRASERTDSTGKKIMVEGKLWGTSVYYYTNGKMCAKEEWKDKLERMECWDEEGKMMPPVTDSSGNYLVRVLPKFNGDLIQFLVKNTKYPKLSRKKEEEGKVYLKFIVEKNGTITNVTVQKTSGHYLLDEEAMRVAYLMSGQWSPGREHNFAIRVYYTLPINFRLR